MNAFIAGNSSLLNILRPLLDDIYISKKVDKTFCLSILKGHSERKIFCYQIPNNKLAGFLLTHLAYLFSFFKIANKIHLILFSQIADYPLLVLFLGKLTNKKIVDFVGGSRISLASIILYTTTSFIRKIACIYAIISLKCATYVADRVIVITSRLLDCSPFDKFKDKVRIALNFPSAEFYTEFRIKKKYEDRDNIIGYIGAFTMAKGVYNFAVAARKIVKQSPKVKIMFIGDYLNSEPPYLGLRIKHLFRNLNNVTFMGRVPHRKVADLLNEMKLVILPSFSEGLPHIVLEAMACGTPVLVTSVGAIPQIVKDGENGFILKSNDSRYIADRIIELLSQPENLKNVSVNAYKYVRKHFSYDKTLKAWRKILSELTSG